MKSSELRALVQTDAEQNLSNWTVDDLRRVMWKTRQYHGGISLQEIAEVIKDTLSVDECHMLAHNLM